MLDYYLRLRTRFRLPFNLFSRILICNRVFLAYLSRIFPASVSSIPLPFVNLVEFNPRIVVQTRDLLRDRRLPDVEIVGRLCDI